jgi:hypothetical protein
MEIREMRKTDMNGKKYCFTIDIPQESGPNKTTVLAAGSDSQMDIWI